jgi:hypothetical protein
MSGLIVQAACVGSNQFVFTLRGPTRSVNNRHHMLGMLGLAELGDDGLERTDFDLKLLDVMWHEDLPKALFIGVWFRLIRNRLVDYDILNEHYQWSLL